MAGGPYFAASVILLILVGGSYIGLASYKRRSYKIDAGEISTVALSAFAIPTGVKICLVSVLASNLGELSGRADRTYILIGALIVTIGSVVAVGRIFRKLLRAEREVSSEAQSNNK